MLKKKLASVMLVLAMVLGMSGTAWAIEDLPVAVENVSPEIYNEENNVCGPEALSIINDNKVFNYFEGIRTTNELEVVGVTEKSVYVSETIGKDQSIIDSHLMSVDEVSAYKAKKVDGGLSYQGADIEVGDATDTMYNITIYLVVYKDRYHNYSAYGTATWENIFEIIGNGEKNPSRGLDFMALTWGGGGELELQNSSFTGYYQVTGDEIESSKAKSDSYSGYCWQFKDVEQFIPFGNEYYMKEATCSVDLSKTYVKYLAKKTNIIFTYIHTYEEHTGSVSFTAGSSGLAGEVSLSGTSKSWQLEVDVTGLWY